MSRRLVLVRHGETAHNATGRLQGQMDTPLSSVGVAQAAQVADYFAGLKLARLYSSDLSRARDTALAIGKTTGQEVVTDRRLRETDLGVWQDASREDIDANYPGMRARWRTDVTWAPPGGETHFQVGDRARQVVDELMLSTPEWDEHPVMIVAHGGLIMGLVTSLLGLTKEQLPAFDRVGNTHWAELAAYPPPAPDGTSFDDGVSSSVAFTEETLPQARWRIKAWNVSATGPARSWGQ